MQAHSSLIWTGFAVLFVCAGAQGQPLPLVWWQEWLGPIESSEVRALTQLSNGDLVVATERHRVIEGFDVLVFKLDGMGNLEWQTSCQPGGRETHLAGLAPTEDGGFVVAGDNRHGEWPSCWFYAIHYLADGSQLWAREYGGWYSASSHGMAMAEDGSITLGGPCTVNDSDYVFAFQLNDVGDSLWTQYYGSSDNRWITGLRSITYGDVAYYGYAWTGNSDDKDFYVLRVDPGGYVVWEGRIPRAGWQAATCLTETSSGDLIVAGLYDHQYHVDMMVERITDLGDSVWTYWRPDTQPSNADAEASGVLVTGKHVDQSAYWPTILKLRDNGSLAWTRGLDSNAPFETTIRLEDGGWLGTGLYGTGVMRTGPDLEQGLVLLRPNHRAQWYLGEVHSVEWSSFAINDPMRIELNRNFPSDEWQLLAENSYNDGVDSVVVSGDSSAHCRIRISTMSGSFADTSDGDFALLQRPIPEVDTLWTRTIPLAYTQVARSVSLRLDGRIVVAGENDAAYYDSLMVVQLTSDGNFIWSRCFGAYAASVRGQSVILGDDGGLFLSGNYFRLQVAVFIVRTDSVGDTLWTRVVGTRRFGGAVRVANGQYVIAGSQHYDFTHDDMVAFSINDSGSFPWFRTFGGDEVDAAYAVTATSDGGFATAGTTESYGAEMRDAWLVKFDAGGYVEWAYLYGEGNDEEAHSILQTPDGGYVFAGFTRSTGGGDKDIYVLRTDAYGLVTWSRSIGGTRDEEASAIIRTSTGHFAIAGTSYDRDFAWGDGYFLELDEDGQELRSLIVGGEHADFFCDVRETADSGFVLVGSSRSFSSDDFEDFYVVRVASEFANDAPGNEPCIPDDFDFRIYPNPFNSTAKLRFSLPNAAEIRVTAYDLLGREAATVVDAWFTPGTHTVNWNARGLASGIYFVRAGMNGNVLSTQKAVLLK